MLRVQFVHYVLSNVTLNSLIHIRQRYKDSPVSSSEQSVAAHVLEAANNRSSYCE